MHKGDEPVPVSLDKTAAKVPIPSSPNQAITDKATSFKDVADSLDFSQILRTVSTAGSTLDVSVPFQAVLDSLKAFSQLHPFVAVAVIPFRLILTLELKRQENDQRVLALIVLMMDMMTDFKVLPSSEVELNFDQDQAMHKLMSEVREKISDCGNAIDVFYGRKKLVRMIHSISWQRKLEAHVQIFTDLKGRLKMELLKIIATASLETKAATFASSVKIDEILWLVRRHSRLETQVLDLIRKYGGIEEAATDKDFLRRLVQILEPVEALGSQKGIRATFLSPSSTSDSEPEPVFPEINAFGPVPPSDVLPYRNPDVRSTSQTRVSSSQRRQGDAAFSHWSPSIPASHLPSQLSLASNRRQRSNTIMPSTTYPSSAPLPIYPSSAPFPSFPPATSVVSIYHRSRSAYAQPPASTPPNNTAPPSRSAMHMTTYYSHPKPPRNVRSHTFHETLGALGRARELPGDEQGRFLDDDRPVSPALIEKYRTLLVFAIKNDLSQMLEQNQGAWMLKVDELKLGLNIQLEYNTQRILAAVKGELHKDTSISDADLQAVWTKQKWLTSVKSDHFIQALQDHMLDDVQMSGARARSEEWAANFLSMPYRTSLLQEIDRDCSGFVSKAEVNLFIKRKPTEISMLLWLAYSAVAWSYEASVCQARIRNSWSKLDNMIRPWTVKAHIFQDIQLSIRPKVAALLDALQIPPRKVAEVSAIPRLAKLVEQGLEVRIKSTTKKLDQVHWTIDNQVTLRAIVGDLPVESFLLPILSILIGRFVDQQEGAKLNLSAEDMFAARDALAVVLDAVHDRVTYLMDSYRVESPGELAFSSGLFSRWELNHAGVKLSLSDTFDDDGHFLIDSSSAHASSTGLRLDLPVPSASDASRVGAKRGINPDATAPDVASSAPDGLQNSSTAPGTSSQVRSTARRRGWSKKYDQADPWLSPPPSIVSSQTHRQFTSSPLVNPAPMPTTFAMPDVILAPPTPRPLPTSIPSSRTSLNTAGRSFSVLKPTQDSSTSTESERAAQASELHMLETARPADESPPPIEVFLFTSSTSPNPSESRDEESVPVEEETRADVDVARSSVGHNLTGTSLITPPSLEASTSSPRISMHGNAPGMLPPATEPDADVVISATISGGAEQKNEAMMPSSMGLESPLNRPSLPPAVSVQTSAFTIQQKQQAVHWFITAALILGTWFVTWFWF